MPHKDRQTRLAYCKAYHREHSVDIAKRKHEYTQKHKKAFSAYKRQWAKAAQLKRYGLTPETYAQLSLKGCVICGNICRLHLDHDHATGKFRGLLCSNHNLALGLFQDSVPDLQNAIDYLRRNQ